MSKCVNRRLELNNITWTLKECLCEKSRWFYLHNVLRLYRQVDSWLWKDLLSLCGRLRDSLLSSSSQGMLVMLIGLPSDPRFSVCGIITMLETMRLLRPPIVQEIFGSPK